MKDKQHWRELCEQAAFEQDPDKLLELVREINKQLEEKGSGTLSPGVDANRLIMPDQKAGFLLALYRLKWAFAFAGSAQPNFSIFNLSNCSAACFNAGSSSDRFGSRAISW
jgi:hypothetical protein